MNSINSSPPKSTNGPRLSSSPTSRRAERQRHRSNSGATRKIRRPQRKWRSEMTVIDRRTMSLLSLAALAAPGTALAADNFPSRAIHLVVGFTPGSSSDISGRIFAKEAGQILGRDVVVDNKPGAAGSIGGAYVAHAAKDGYTLFLCPLSTVTNKVA